MRKKMKNNSSSKLEIKMKIDDMNNAASRYENFILIEPDAFY
jgi:hypothetical protein